MWSLVTTLSEILGRPLTVTFKPKYKAGHVLELSDEAKPDHMDYKSLFGMIIGREAAFIKIMGLDREKAHYHVQLYDSDYRVLEGSSHLLPFVFVDNLFTPHVAYSMEGMTKAKGKK